MTATAPDLPEEHRFAGLVNLHDHLRAFLPAGRAGERAPLAEVVTRAAAAQAVADPDDYRALTALAAARQVLAGTTTVVDHVYPLRREGLLDAVLDGYAAVGVRGVVAIGVLTRTDAALRTTVTDAVALAAALPADRRGAVRYLAPVSLRQNVIEDFRDAAIAAREADLGLYTHIAENEAEVEQCLAEHGRRPVEVLADCGFLTDRTVLVHAICLSDSELRLVADSGTTLVYCPTNHARLAKPVARIPELLAAGATVTLGVDGAESVWHEMRQAVAVQAQRLGAPGALSTDQALRMATTGARGALRRHGVVTGEPAGDEVVVDLRGPGVQPLADIDWALVHRVVPADVRDVTVAGVPAVRDGRLVRSDVHHLARAARESTSRIAQRCGRQTHRTPAGTGRRSERNPA